MEYYKLQVMLQYILFDFQDPPELIPEYIKLWEKVTKLSGTKK